MTPQQTEIAAIIAEMQEIEHGMGALVDVMGWWHRAAFRRLVTRLRDRLAVLSSHLQVQEEQEVARIHNHLFGDYSTCRICGKTEAAIEGCHHCDDVDSVHNGRCWWCLTPILPAVSATTADQGSKDEEGKSKE